MQLIDRRDFLKKSGIAAAATIAGISSLTSCSHDRGAITILHTNDTHSRIDPYPDNDPNFPGMGGYARRASIINQRREQDPDLLLLDAGDIFQGTPYYNMYGGEPELRLMSKMGYDAAAFGNHEFDNGLDGFKRVLPFSKFPFLAANYDFSRTVLAGDIRSYTIVKKSGKKIGIYGLGINPEGLVSSSLYAGTRYLDPIEVARAVENELYARHHCQLIICLSHLGFRYDDERPSDAVLAASTRFTDIIIGGHTHNLLDPPVVISNQDDKPVSIGQAGYGGAFIGMMTVHFNEYTGEKYIESYTTKI